MVPTVPLCLLQACPQLEPLASCNTGKEGLAEYLQPLW